MDWDTEQQRRCKKRSMKKPFTILTRTVGSCMLDLFPSWGLWRVYNRYRTEKDRDKALAALQRKARFCEYKAGE